MKEDRIKFKRVILVLFASIILISFRNFILMLMIPALSAWWLSKKKLKRPILVFAITYALFTFLFFSIRYLVPSLDLPQSVVNRQEAFETLQGNSSINPLNLKPDFISFLKNFPKALSVTTLRPNPSDVKHLLSLAAAFETVFLLSLVLIFIFWREGRIKATPFNLFCFFFSFSLLLSIGYTVNFLGAIVRYRSVIIPLIMIPIIAHIDWKRIFPVLINNISENNNMIKSEK